METAYFIRQAEEIYGEDVVEDVKELLESEHAAEAFFGTLAQKDLLIAEDDVDITEGYYYNYAEWTILDIVAGAREEGMLATKQDKPTAPMIVHLAEVAYTIAHDALARAAIAKAAEEGEGLLAAELDERQKNVEIVRKAARQAIEWIRAGEDARPGLGAADIETEEKAAEASTAVEERPKAVTLSSGLTIRLDDDPAAPAASQGEKT